MGFCQSSFRPALLPIRDREALHQAYGYQDRGSNDGLAHVPSHVSFVAGRDRSTDEIAAGIDATRFHRDDNQCLWASNVVIEAGSEWEGCGDGAKAVESERLKPNFSYGNISGAEPFSGRLEVVNLIWLRG